ncbi:MAG: hypothetical protein K6C13_08865 [Oscillospiraceae bacterium]|nr:hypothetical protein [Oscillospiraceae bacterium]
MGYIFSTCKDSKKLVIDRYETILATDEEVEIAKLYLLPEFDDDFVRMEKELSEDVASYVYRRTLVIFLGYVQEWMNTALHYSSFEYEYRPSATEEAVMVIATRISLPDFVSEYIERKSYLRDYTIYQISDEKILSLREEFEIKNKPSEDGLIAIGSTAYHVDDYERVITVTVTNRKGFFFFCKDSEGEDYYVPYHELFRTKEEANRMVSERNERRDNAIEKYHLLDPTDNEQLHRDRSVALKWLHYNQDIPELLVKELEISIKMMTAV